jgi:predicted RNA polymerase sigma factor
MMRHIGSDDPSLASYHVRRAIKAGLLKKLGRTGGWAAI